jgi:hypothetical protein
MYFSSGKGLKRKPRLYSEPYNNLNYLLSLAEQWGLSYYKPGRLSVRLKELAFWLEKQYNSSSGLNLTGLRSFAARY